MQAISTFPFHFHFHTVDADELRDFVILHSKYNVTNKEIQLKEQYTILPYRLIYDIPNDIEHLNLCGLDDSEYDRLIFSNHSFHQLKSIEIVDKTFQHVREFVVEGLASLESVKIGDMCFRKDKKERNDGLCRITNCPNLRQLEIGYKSFVDVKSFELSNLNSIQSIKFGWGCFYYADFSLKGEWKERKE